MAKNDIEYTAKIGMTTISTANSNLDGTGTLGTVFTASADASVKRITIKSIEDTTDGVVRIFIDDGSGADLLREVKVSGRDRSGIIPAFSYVINFPGGLSLDSGDIIKASTENAESFNVIAEVVEWTNPASQTKIDQESFNAMVQISSGTSSLGGGAHTPPGSLLITATSTGKGTFVNSISIKALGNTDQGMIRVFLYDGTNNILLQEVRVPELVRSATTYSFGKTINFPGGLRLEKDWKLYVSTEKSNTFELIANGYNWTYNSI